jgi:cytochrome c oxidase subunit 1
MEVMAPGVSIGRRYIGLGLVFLFLGGALAMLMRAQLAWPGFVTPAGYQQLFTMHGLIMIFWAATPILFGGLGNALIPSLVGAKASAYPRLATASFIVFALSGAVMLTSFGAPLGAASAGWTSYPPLSTAVATPGLGQTLVLIAVSLAACSTLLGAINFAATIALCRADGLTWLRLPLSVWGWFLASLLNVVFLPVLLVATGLLLSDRVFGTAFFARDGDPMLYQHLFWIFGHPEVYVLILPIWGIVSDLLAIFSRKPAWFYNGTVASLCCITALSGLVYGHHLYQSGLSPLLGRSFMALTLLISMPAMLMVLNWLQTLRGGALEFQTPMLFALGTLLVFSVGGISGLSLAAVITNLYLHNTLYVVGHFHLTLAGSALLGLYAALYYWFPHVFGRALDERWGRVHFALTLVLFVLVFSGLLLAGYSGQPRRLADPYAYDFVKPLRSLNQWTTHLAFLLGLAQLIFVANVVKALRKAPATQALNPWRAGTLEWMPGEPVLRGPHELSNPELVTRLGRDWAGQAER